MIKSVSNGQDAVLKGVIDLWIPSGFFELDPCYSSGGFYKSGVIPQPTFKFDIAPRSDDVFEADVCRLSEYLPAGCITSAIFDPPFIHAAGEGSKMGNRFDSFPSQAALFEMYRMAAKSLYRVMAPGGILCWKTQGIVESGKQVWNPYKIWHMMTGFPACDDWAPWTMVDEIVLIRDHVMTGHNHGRQVHARRHHSLFQVYKRGNNP